MTDFPVKPYSRTTQSTQAISPTATKELVSELDADILKCMFASLRILNLGTMRMICEQRLNPRMTQDDVTNFITQSCVNNEGMNIQWLLKLNHEDCINNEAVNIQWLFGLNQEGVEKVLKIINRLNHLTASEKRNVFPATRNYYDLNYDPNPIPVEIYSENFDRGIIANRSIYAKYDTLYLEEKAFSGPGKTTLLLEASELVALLYQDTPKELWSIGSLPTSARSCAIEIKIEDANRTKLECDDAVLALMINHVSRFYSHPMKKDNVGALIQIVMLCITRTTPTSPYYSLSDIKLVLNWYTESLAKFFRKSETTIINNSSQNSEHHVHAMDFSNSACLEQTVGEYKLVADVNAQLFEHAQSIQDQWSLAKTSKANLKAYEEFCASNLKNEDVLVKTLLDQGWSATQIFMKCPSSRPDRFVPLCQAGLNKLALNILNPNVIELIRNGSKSIAEAKEDVRKFEEKYKATEYLANEIAYNRYTQFDFKLPEELKEYNGDFYYYDSSDDEYKDEFDSSLEYVFKVGYLQEPLLRFAVNSLQLEITEAASCLALLGKRRFEQRWNFWNKTKPLNLTDHENVRNLLIHSKLTVKRYLQLTDAEVLFLTDKNKMYHWIMEDFITIDPALSLFALIEEYKKSGFAALEKGIHQAKQGQLAPTPP